MIAMTKEDARAALAEKAEAAVISWIKVSSQFEDLSMPIHFPLAMEELRAAAKDLAEWKKVHPDPS